MLLMILSTCGGEWGVGRGGGNLEVGVLAMRVE